MVSGVVTSDGDVTPLFIFLNSLRLITEANIKCFELIEQAWMAAGRLSVWLQDCAIPYKQEKKFLRPDQPEHLAANTPRLPSPWLFYVDAVKQEINKIPCNIKDKLKAKITIAFTNLKKETVGKASRRFRSRLKAGIKVSGDFFEYI